MNAVMQALQARDRADVVVRGSDRALSAGQLLDGAAALGQELHGHQVSRLALLAGNSPAWVTTDISCLNAGICLLPLPTFFSAEQILHSLVTVGVDAVLTDDPQRLAALVSTRPIASDWCEGNELTLLRLTDVHPGVLPANTRKVTFTSGSTGSPRGVCLSAPQQLAVAEALQTVLQLPAPEHLCLLPLSTLLENICGVYLPLISHGIVHVPPESDTGFSGSTGLDMLTLLRAIDSHQPTSMILLPQMLVGLVVALEAGWRPPATLRFAAVGGSRVSPELLRAARDFGLPVYEGYGLSETASVACLNVPGRDRVGSAGSPLPHVDVEFEDGEIVISGNSFLGYAGAGGAASLPRVHTGDLGHRDDDGFVYVHGRRKNLLISSFGRNISPEWVESLLLNHRCIRQCIVIGDGQPFCAALISPLAATRASEIDAALASVNSQLPDYARVRTWRRLPQPLTQAQGLLTDNGKPRRDAIAARYADLFESIYRDEDRAVAS